MADTAEATPPLKTYRGNCHCAAFVYEVKLPEIKNGFVCNCSICTKKAYVWAFPLADEDFTVVKGSEDDLTVYKFAAGKLVHKFCPKCGTAVLARRQTETKGLGINVRGIQGPIDLHTLQKVPFDGGAMEPKYEAPVYSGPEPTGGPEDAKMYRGSCHCGAVTYAARLKPLEELDQKTHEERILDCNCSICGRHGYLWIYPNKDQVAMHGSENLTSYPMSGLFGKKVFCKTCGVHIGNPFEKVSDERLATLPEHARKFREGKDDWMPMNLRAFNGVDLTPLKITTFDGYHELKPSYVNP